MKRKGKTTTTITKKKRKKSPTPQSSPNPSLTDDLILFIVARVPRLYYPTLSLVSKSFRSLVASPELYKVRSLLGLTESCLYVCLKLRPYSYSWFTLCRKPDQTLTNDASKKSSGYVLAKVPVPDTPAHFSGLVAIGSDIYNIGGSICQRPSSSVSILDCRSHTWREAPSLPSERRTLSASFLDGKIYVAGYSMDESVNNSVVVFDTETQMWGPESIPCIREKTQGSFLFCRSVCIDGKFHVATFTDAIAYISQEGRWDRVPGMQSHLRSDSYCQIDNVLYAASDGVLIWYDTEVRMWRNLQGLVGLPKFRRGGSVRLADYGGKLAVLWDQTLTWIPSRGNRMLIWCAEIALERPKSCEIWGKVEWFDHVHEVPGNYEFINVLAPTV